MQRRFNIDHEEPNSLKCDYILLPYGIYYKKTYDLLSCKPGDTIRFFNGRDAEIKSARVVEDGMLCDDLCRMRYGIPWRAAYDRWVKYAMFEGHGRDILVPDKCILLTFVYLCQENSK